jgi:hypothetical protein
MVAVETHRLPLKDCEKAPPPTVSFGSIASVCPSDSVFPNKRTSPLGVLVKDSSGCALHRLTTDMASTNEGIGAVLWTVAMIIAGDGTGSSRRDWPEKIQEVMMSHGVALRKDGGAAV